jgi:lipopolysaccharide/colanic/teichoic acid biosynthesis glycosyltransferase
VNPFDWKNAFIASKDGTNSLSLLSLRTSESSMCSISQFQKVLALERKRAERSRRPFILMLIDMRNILSAGYDYCTLVSGILSVLTASTRNTDIRGWFGSNVVIGTIFNELGEQDVNVAQSVIHKKVHEELCCCLDHEIVRNLHITYQQFPESPDERQRVIEPDLTLYPDIQADYSSRKFGLVVKRMIDVIGSALALIYLAPIILIITAAIKLTSKGPVFFRQERVGQFGRKFILLKFRSMYVNNDSTIHREYVEKLITGLGPEDSGACRKNEEDVFKIKSDPRVTPIGRLIRKTSLDEIPQFINVLKGDMSLVGPRPPLQYELNCYDIWHRRRILEMKPGITGLWQVTGRSRTSFDEMVRLDLRYTKEWSLWLDLKLLLLTPWVVITCKGGY